MTRTLSEWKKINKKKISEKLEYKFPPLGLDKTAYLEGKCKCGHPKEAHYHLQDHQDNLTAEDFRKDHKDKYVCKNNHTILHSDCRFCREEFYRYSHTDWYLQCGLCWCKYYNPEISKESVK